MPEPLLTAMVVVAAGSRRRVGVASLVRAAVPRRGPRRGARGLRLSAWRNPDMLSQPFDLVGCVLSTPGGVGVEGAAVAVLDASKKVSVQPPPFCFGLS